MKGVITLARTYPEYDYDLAEGLFQELSNLGVSVLAERLSGQFGKQSELQNFFLEYGNDLAKQVLSAGKKYKDRTCEVMEEVAQKTGLVFPSIPQRYIEVWLLATRPQDKWKLLESTPKRLVFAVNECSLYQLIKKKVPSDISLPCRHACLTVLEGIYQGLGLSVKVALLNDMERDGKCCFSSEIAN